MRETVVRVIASGFYRLHVADEEVRTRRYHRYWGGYHHRLRVDSVQRVRCSPQSLERSPRDEVCETERR